ncbi:type II toxin-antitoxin system prevent-host-death family antitoxin [Phytoactinopolyspora limicola]|uniref:type II toxin-antitoxin system prevent-host-death family antitoxin n=1 Tax=Phytoactinopolyspora limicola TaxID=2715536 RepID=UPI00140BCB62|nr:type II toxin-antitoxin system prevent-host-death family antitoxin [Phytoactinopolyspora limicola]
MSGSDADRVWTVAEAKSRFSELVHRASRDGPQVVTRRGEEVVVVVATDEWHRKSTRKGSLAEFFANSPMAGLDVDVERIEIDMREADLDGPEYAEPGP